jgi:multidrug efflux pump subunit AcrB
MSASLSVQMIAAEALSAIQEVMLLNFSNSKPPSQSGESEKPLANSARGFGYEWTGQSLQEKLSGSQAPFLLGLSVLVVFLLLAALY